jgi:hypothetical protein
MCSARTNRMLPVNPAEMMVFQRDCHEKCLDHQQSIARFQSSIDLESERDAPGALFEGSPIIQRENFTIGRFHSQNHFFVNIHIPASIEAKPERIVRLADNQSAERNSRFPSFDLQNYLATQPIRVRF